MWLCDFQSVSHDWLCDFKSISHDWLVLCDFKSVSHDWLCDFKSISRDGLCNFKSLSHDWVNVMQEEGLIQPRIVDGLGSAPRSGQPREVGEYNPVEFCLPIGPIFSFVKGNTNIFLIVLVDISSECHRDQ